MSKPACIVSEALNNKHYMDTLNIKWTKILA